MEGLSGAAAALAVLPFPSHEIDPYRGLAPHVGVTSVGARASRRRHRHGPCRLVASAAALLPENQRADASAGRGARSQAGAGHRADRSRRAPRRRRASRARIRPTSTASSPSAAASSTSFPPAKRSRCGSSSSATRSNPCAATTRPRSARSNRSTRSRSCRFRDVLAVSLTARADSDKDWRRRPACDDRSATVFDYMRLAQGAASSCPSATRSTTTR